MQTPRLAGTCYRAANWSCAGETAGRGKCDRTLPEVSVTALLATEPRPPADEDPLDWLRLTNLPVETPEQAIEQLSWYPPVSG